MVKEYIRHSGLFFALVNADLPISRQQESPLPRLRRPQQPHPGGRAVPPRPARAEGAPAGRHHGRHRRRLHDLLAAGRNRLLGERAQLVRVKEQPVSNLPIRISPGNARL